MSPCDPRSGRDANFPPALIWYIIYSTWVIWAVPATLTSWPPWPYDKSGLSLLIVTTDPALKLTSNPSVWGRDWTKFHYRLSVDESKYNRPEQRQGYLLIYNKTNYCSKVFLWKTTNIYFLRWCIKLIKSVSKDTIMFTFDINAVLLDFLFICEYWKIKCISFHQNIVQHDCFWYW